MLHSDGTHKPAAGDTARIHYVGTLSDGSCFDSSRDRGQPFEFKVGAAQVISGLDLLLPLMSINEVVEAKVPASFAYGEHGFPPIIPAKADLCYNVELISFHRAGK